MKMGQQKCYINYYMKNRLGRIRTTYNQEGDYDHDLYFKQQKSVYKRQIDFATRVDAITEKQFTLKPLEIGFLNSNVLKDEQKFKEIKKMMLDYNKGIIEKGGQPVNGGHLKKVVMESMLKFMNLMMLAPDAATKRTILDIAYHWFIRHLDPKSAKKSARELQNQIKQILVQKQLLPIDIVNRELILNKVNEQLYPYKIKARTMYQELDDPKHQLENYNTHKLEFMANNIKSNNEKNKQKKWIDTVKFPRIQPLAFAIEEVNIDKKEDEEKIQNTVQEPPKTDQPPVQGQQGIKFDAQGKPILPQENVVNDQPQGGDLDFGQPPDPDAEPEEPQQDENKRGKLDPLLKIFILERIRQKQKAQIACEKVRQKQINKINITSQQDFLNGDYIREWAKQRARIKTQVSKKHQSMRGVEKILRGKQNVSETFIENDIDKIKVKNIISQCKRDLTTVQPPPEQLNAEAGLSVFDRRRVKTEASHKPFSTILTDYSKKQEENVMLSEIDSIKQKFSKYKLFAPMDKLIKGLAPPDKQYFEDDDKLVWPNSQMLSNPFIKVAKKKKKKKKK